MREFYSKNQLPSADKGGGGQKIQKCCGHHIWKLPPPESNMNPFAKSSLKRDAPRRTCERSNKDQQSKGHLSLCCTEIGQKVFPRLRDSPPRSEVSHATYEKPFSPSLYISPSSLARLPFYAVAPSFDAKAAARRWWSNYTRMHLFLAPPDIHGHHSDMRGILSCL